MTGDTENYKLDGVPNAARIGSIYASSTTSVLTVTEASGEILTGSITYLAE